MSQDTSCKEAEGRSGEQEGGGQEEEEEEWEAVSVDREQWARLTELLELLTEFSLVGGASFMESLPPVVFTKSFLEEEDYKILDLKKMKLKMLFAGKFLNNYMVLDV